MRILTNRKGRYVVKINNIFLDNYNNFIVIWLFSGVETGINASVFLSDQVRVL